MKSRGQLWLQGRYSDVTQIDPAYWTLQRLFKRLIISLMLIPDVRAVGRGATKTPLSLKTAAAYNVACARKKSEYWNTLNTMSCWGHQMSILLVSPARVLDELT